MMGYWVGLVVALCGLAVAQEEGLTIGDVVLAGTAETTTDTQQLTEESDVPFTFDILIQQITPSPSSHPTDVPPTELTTNIQNGLQTLQPTTNYLETPDALSDTPSDTPSDHPSLLPSDSPSTVPSQSPSSFEFVASEIIVTSDAPSMVPSLNIPSDVPSIVPSDAPSMVPSDMPSLLPSLEPSTLPSRTHPANRPLGSSRPTGECHDLATYQSPLNQFECHDHRGTDCTAWRYLGLTVEQVIVLLQSCPESCRIDCGELVPFEFTLSFGLHRVPSFLGPSSVTRFEDITTQYLNNYVEGESGKNSFFLYKVELLSQNIVQRRFLRTELTDNTVNLVTKVRFTGYALEMDKLSLETEVVAGISSQGFTNAIQRSGDQSFVDLKIVPSIVTSAAQRQPTAVESGSGAGWIVAIVVVAVVAIGAGLYVYLWYKNDWTGTAKAVSSGLSSNSNSDAAAARSPRSSIGQILSFESVRNIVASPRRSNEESTTQADNSDNSLKEAASSGLDVYVEDNNSGDQDDITTDDEEENDDEDEDEQPEEEHPYTGIIPPMIVYDNIDDDWSPEATPKPKVRNIVPSRRIEASPDLVQRIRTGGPSRAFDDEFYNANCGNSFHSLPSGEQSKSSFATQEFSHVPLLRESNSDPGQLESRKELPPLSNGKAFGNGRQSSLGSAESSMMNPLFSSSGTLGDSDSGDGEPSKQRSDTAGRLMQTIFGSPGKKLRKSLASNREASPSHRRVRASPRLRKHGHYRTSSRGSDDACAVEDHNIVSSNNDFTGSQITCHVPRHGKLGLDLECNVDGRPGVVIKYIKDYSPLLGKVKENDRILTIDGVDVSHETELLGVSGLLRGNKSGARWAQSNTMKIVFLRAEPDDLSSLLEVSADSTEDFLDFLANHM